MSPRSCSRSRKARSSPARSNLGLEGGIPDHRRQGLGSFVAAPTLKRAPSYLLSFTEAVSAQGRVATHRLLGFGPAPWRDTLPYEPETPLIRLDRLRLPSAASAARSCLPISMG